MPVCKLEEQLGDLRSDQVAYKLTIENADDQAITLFSVEPRVPVDAKLVEIIDTSLAEANARRAELLEELNRLLRQHLCVWSADFRKTWVERQQEMLRDLLSVTGYFKALFEVTTFNWEARMRKEFDSFEFKIGSAVDARSAYVRWLEKSSDESAVRSLYEAKLEQLEKLEIQMDEGDRPGLTRIEPRGSFTATYVLKFSRRLFEPRKYQIGFDATYGALDGGPQQSSNAAANLLISPYPAALSVVAVLSALLGVLIRESLAGAADPLSELAAQALTGRLLVGPIVALVFFNVYEHSSAGKELSMPLSWRSALLIGVLCGMAQDRILSSLKALIGA